MTVGKAVVSGRRTHGGHHGDSAVLQLHGSSALERRHFAISSEPHRVPESLDRKYINMKPRTSNLDVSSKTNRFLHIYRTLPEAKSKPAPQGISSKRHSMTRYLSMKTLLWQTQESDWCLHTQLALESQPSGTLPHGELSPCVAGHTILQQMQTKTHDQVANNFHKI